MVLASHSTKLNLADHNALIVVFWAMLLTSATSFTGTPPSYKFKNKGSQATSFANNVVASLDESVNLTRSEYQQLLSLLNSHSHFGTQAPPEGGSNAHQVANIITQPTIGL